MDDMTSPPVILCLSGLDPSGGAGIQADITAIQRLNCHSMPVITSLTDQDTHNVKSCHPVEANLLASQIDTVIKDRKPDAIKLGLIDHLETIEVIVKVLSAYPSIPVIADPVLRASGGFDFSGDHLAKAYIERLLPLCSLLTPNLAELHRLAPGILDKDDDKAALTLTRKGCDHILVTRGDASDDMVTNTLYGKTGSLTQWQWPRLPGRFHGSGCTLASAIAAYTGLGMTIEDACFHGQQYTQQTLSTAYRISQGQYIPNR